MKRKIIEIDEQACNGCGLCAAACHEGAIALVEGKARLVREDYCDGLGNCLPACPTGAITIVEREAPAFTAPPTPAPAHTCPGAMARALNPASHAAKKAAPVPLDQTGSELMQWPVQIKLVPVSAPYFEGAHLLIAADCAAYAHAAFHSRFMRNKITLIGCPKLDEGDYADKLTEILRQNNIRSIQVVRMEVPCCGGLEHAVQKALLQSGKMIPWQVTVLSTGGEELEV